MICVFGANDICLFSDSNEYLFCFILCLQENDEDE